MYLIWLEREGRTHFYKARDRVGFGPIELSISDLGLYPLLPKRSGVSFVLRLALFFVIHGQSQVPQSRGEGIALYPETEFWVPSRQGAQVAVAGKLRGIS